MPHVKPRRSKSCTGHALSTQAEVGVLDDLKALTGGEEVLVSGGGDVIKQFGGLR